MHTVPAMIPPDPNPAIALPMTRATELGAAPQIADPTSKNRIAAKNTPFTLKNEYSLPQSNWKAQLVIW